MKTAISTQAALLFKLQDFQPTLWPTDANTAVIPLNFSPGVKNMKFIIKKMITIAAICLVSLAAGTRAYALEDCSDSTLSGDYASTVSGQLFHADGTSETRQGVVMAQFNGHGGFTQTDYVPNTVNGITQKLPGPLDPVSGFQTDESGTYRVNADCTGNLTINFAPPPVPGATGAVIRLLFVLGSHGDWLRTVVVDVTPPSVIPNDITGFALHSEGTRLGEHN
jgi:hypothetical protein